MKKKNRIIYILMVITVVISIIFLFMIKSARKKDVQNKEDAFLSFFRKEIETEIEEEKEDYKTYAIVFDSYYVVPQTIEYAINDVTIYKDGKYNFYYYVNVSLKLSYNNSEYLANEEEINELVGQTSEGILFDRHNNIYESGDEFGRFFVFGDIKLNDNEIDITKLKKQPDLSEYDELYEGKISYSWVIVPGIIILVILIIIRITDIVKVSQDKKRDKELQEYYKKTVRFSRNTMPTISIIHENVFKKDNNVEEEFNQHVKYSKEKPQERYSVDMGLINQVHGLMQGYLSSQMQKGIQMQSEEGPQTDWAIAGGFANGLAGAGVGVAVALSTMQDNIESTRKHHELGRKLELNAKDNLESLNSSMESLYSKKIDNHISGNRINNFEVSDEMPELIDCFQLDNITVNTYSTMKIVEASLLNGGKMVEINEYAAYRSIGYFKATVYINNNFYTMFNNEKDRKIDGSFKVSILEDGREIAYSYVNGKYAIDNISEVGFGNKINEEMLFKFVNGCVNLNPNIDYTVKLSDPYLWLVKQV